MGNNNNKEQQKIAIYSNTLNIEHLRFVSSKSLPSNEQYKQKINIKLSEFKRMENWEIQLEGITPNENLQNILISQVYFKDQSHLDIYLGTLFALKQLCGISLYDDIEIKSQKLLFGVAIKQTLPYNSQQSLNRRQIKGNINKCLDLLILICKILSFTQNLYIPPEEIIDCNGQFYLKGFYYKQYSKKKYLRSLFAWLQEQYDEFTQKFQGDHIITFQQSHIYIKEINTALQTNKINEQHLVFYLNKIKQKIAYLAGNFDSFQACYRTKRTKNNTIISSKEWIIAKKHSQIYFFNVKDLHLSQGKIVRKKRKINVESTHVIFNTEQFQVNFILDGSKNMVRTSQFQVQDVFTISDIQIKHKFPFKIKNPFMFQRGRQIYMFDQVIYKYSIEQNKIYQQSKKISDLVILSPAAELNYFAVRLSIDIFRHGINIYVDDKYEILHPSGNPSLTADLQNIKIDIKHVQFCIQVYKGVFLMFASRNLWILDINFMCFFSYAPFQRLKDFCRTKSKSDVSDYAFQVINQPFPVVWLTHQDGLNISIIEDTLHMIGSVMGKLFYLQYQFIFEAGILKLKKYAPLFRQQSLIDSTKQQSPPIEESKFIISVHMENLQYYKNDQWIYKGRNLIEIKKFKSSVSKNNIQIILNTQSVLTSLKQALQYNKQIDKKWDTFQTAMFLCRIIEIFNQISKMGISHKNFNVSNLLITHNKQLKLKGWSEPSRNWYISDYRDFLLVCFNIITFNTSEKLSDKLIDKYNQQLSVYPVLKQKMINSLKNKVAQKKYQQDKLIDNIYQSLLKLISPLLQNYKGPKYIATFQLNTPNLSIVNVDQCKIKKYKILFEESNNNKEQYTFKSTDSYAWNDQECKLYIFTAQYQMFEAVIHISDEKQQTILLEQYQYPPLNITDCSYIYTKKGLFAFGGIIRSSKSKLVYNYKIYHFNLQKLTWIPLAQIQQPRMNPKLILSESGTKVYILGGQLDCGPQFLSFFEFDALNNSVKRLTDFGCKNPILNMHSKSTYKIFHISQKYSTFLFFTVNATSFNVKVISNMIGGAQLDFQGKIYLQQTFQIPPVSITIFNGLIHFVRQYGRYTKISLSSLQSLVAVHKTLYIK